MRHLLCHIFGALLWGCSAHAQVSLTGWSNIQFTDQAGRALASGLVYTCAAGASCPGTPLPTYTTSSGSVQHANPIRLDAAGRPPGGGQIWLTNGVAYKFVVTNISGSTIPGAGGDNILGGGGGGGGGTGSWTISGADQYNSNAGNVGIGTSSPLAKLGVVGNLDLKGSFILRNSDVTPHTITETAPSGMGSSYSITRATALPGSISCRMMSAAGIETFDATCGGGGGGGGSGAGNLEFTFSAATTVALAHNLNSKDILVDCYDNATPRNHIALDANFPTITDANNATATWTGAKTGYCVVNSSAGNPNIWKRDSNANITLTDSSTTVSTLNFQDQTPAIGVTGLSVKAGDGQSTLPLLSIADKTAAVIYAQFQPNFLTLTGASSGASYLLKIRDTGTVPGINLYSTTSTKQASWSAGATSAFSVQNTADLFRFVVLQNGNTQVGATTDQGFKFYVNGDIFANGNITCAGACGGGGGGGNPFSDAVALIKKNSDATALLRFDATNVPTATTAVLGVQAPGTYTLAATNLAQTFSALQTFTANAIFGTTNTLSLQPGVVQMNDGSGNARVQLSFGGPAGNGIVTTFNTSGTPINVLNQNGLSTTCSAACLSITGTTSGTIYPVAIRDSGGAPGINFFRNTNVKAGSISAGAITALLVQDQSDAYRFVIFQNGHTQINSTTDQGDQLYVTSDLATTAYIANTSLASGSTALVGASTSGPGLWGFSFSVGPDIAIGSSPSVGISLRTGAPSGACNSGSLYLRNDSPPSGQRGYFCVTGAWVGVF